MTILCFKRNKPTATEKREGKKERKNGSVKGIVRRRIVGLGRRRCSPDDEEENLSGGWGPPREDETHSFTSPFSLAPHAPEFLFSLEYLQANRVRSFPHVDGNYALHVYIPVYVPQSSRKELTLFLKKVCSLVPDLHVVEADVALGTLCKDDGKLERVAVAREFHISLGRTVAIRVHQMDSMVSMLRQRLQLNKQYWIDFDKWEVFVNDDRTRTFLSVEVVTGGLPEIVKQIQLVNDVYKLHNLPEFYKDPRPHISLAWASGDVSDSLKRAVEQETKRSGVRGSLQKCIFSCKFGGIECKIGNKTYKICKAENDK